MTSPPIEPQWSPQDALQRVEDALYAAGSRVIHRPDGSMLASCVVPGHDDSHPSLSATWTATDYGGRVLLNCFACAGVPQEDFAEYLGLTYDDLFDDRRWSLHNRRKLTRSRSEDERRVWQEHAKTLGPLPERVAGKLDELLGKAPAKAERKQESLEGHEHTWSHVCTYTYRSAAGAEVQRVKRMRCDGCKSKTFFQSYLHPTGRWEKEAPKEFTPVLYRLPELLEALKAGDDVWVVEGEKDADTGAKLGLATTTNRGGAKNFPADVEPFAGAVVNVVLDRDPAGWVRGQLLHRLLNDAGAAEVHLLLPAVTERKADLTDHVEAGHGIDEFVEVPLSAIDAWAAIDTLHTRVRSLEHNESELRAQLTLAAHEKRAGRDSRSTQHRKNAQRWARESIKVLTRIASIHAQVVRSVDEAGDCDFALEAKPIAQRFMTQARDLAIEMYELAGVDVPAEVARSAAQAESAKLTAASCQHAAATGTEGAAAPTTTSSTGESGSTSQHLTLVGGGNGGGGGGASRPHQGISRTEYDIVAGAIVEQRTVTVGRGDAAYTEDRPSLVINTVLTIHSKEYLERAEELDDNDPLEQLIGREGRATVKPAALPKVAHVVVEYRDGDGVTQMKRIPHDDFDSGKWLTELPIPGLEYGKGKSGRERVIAAMNQLSTAWRVTTSYTATGWRRLGDGRYVYITDEGAIGANGYEPIATHLTGPLKRFNWPNPVEDGTRLREAFLTDSAALMQHFPDRVAGVLLGTAYRSVLGRNPWVTLLVASPGVGKSGLAALTMHHFGERWDRDKPLTSMSGNGATMNAARMMLHSCKDALAFLDDVAPTNGIEAALRHQNEIVRLIHNAEERARSSRDGQKTEAGTAPRASGLITSEFMPPAGSSGGRRALVTPLLRRDIDTELIEALDTAESRHGRALLTSSFLQWIAGRYDEAQQQLREHRSEYAAMMRHAPDAPVTWRNHAAKVAELWAGWMLMLSFLEDAGALSEAEVKTWTTRVDAALKEAADAAEDRDLATTTGQRVVEMLRHALTTGAAYTSDIVTGRAPEGIARRLGWRERDSAPSAGMGMQPSEWAHDPRAVHLGWANTAVMRQGVGRELVCTQADFEKVLKLAISEMVDSVQIDRGTAIRALAEDGVLKVDVEARGGSSVVRHTVKRTISCMPDARDPHKAMRDRFLVLDLDKILGGIDDEDPSGPDGSDGGRGGDEPDGPTPQPTQEPDTTQLELDAPAQEDTMGSHTNTGGLTLPTEQLDETVACAVCTKPSGFAFAGLPLHAPCFWNTSAATIDALLRDLTPQQSSPNPDRQPQAPPAAQQQPATQQRAQSTPATKKATAPAAATASRFRASVAVVDVDAAWLPDGTRIALEQPPAHFGDLEQLGRSLQLGSAPIKWRKVAEAGTIVPTTALLKHLGVDMDNYPRIPSRRPQWLQEISQGLPAIDTAVEQGWTFGREGSQPQLRGLTRIARQGAQRAEIVILLLAQLDETWGLQDADPVTVARVLQIFTETVGIPFKGTPISTVEDLLHLVWSPQRKQQLTCEDPVDYSKIGPANARDLEPAFDWTRSPRQDELSDGAWMAVYDRGSSYLAGWSDIKIGVGAPEHLTGDDVVFDRRRAGWWKIQLPHRAEGDTTPYPDLLDPLGNRSGQEVWTVTPVLEYAASIDITPTILEAWVWPPERSTNLLEPLYKHIRGALEAARGRDEAEAAIVLRMIKQLYKSLSGWMVSADSDPRTNGMAGSSRLNLHHPYAYHAMRGKARVGMLHTVLSIGERTGTWPLIVSNTDAVGYAVSSSIAHTDESGAWPGDPKKIGKSPGSYKLVSWSSLEEQREYLTGRGWSGREATHDVEEQA